MPRRQKKNAVGVCHVSTVNGSFVYPLNPLMIRHKYVTVETLGV